MAAGYEADTEHIEKILIADRLSPASGAVLSACTFRRNTTHPESPGVLELPLGTVEVAFSPRGWRSFARSSQIEVSTDVRHTRITRPI